MPGLSKDDLLSNVCYDLDKGYGSALSLYTQAKEEHLYTSLGYAKNGLNNNPINKDTITKDTTAIKHHFNDLNTKFVLWVRITCVCVYVYTYIYI